MGIGLAGIRLLGSAIVDWVDSGTTRRLMKPRRSIHFHLQPNYHGSSKWTRPQPRILRERECLPEPGVLAEHISSMDFLSFH